MVQNFTIFSSHNPETETALERLRGLFIVVMTISGDNLPTMQ